MVYPNKGPIEPKITDPTMKINMTQTTTIVTF